MQRAGSSAVEYSPCTRGVRGSNPLQSTYYTVRNPLKPIEILSVCKNAQDSLTTQTLGDGMKTLAGEAS